MTFFTTLEAVPTTSGSPFGTLPGHVSLLSALETTALEFGTVPEKKRTDQLACNAKKSADNLMIEFQCIKLNKNIRNNADFLTSRYDLLLDT